MGTDTRPESRMAVPPAESQLKAKVAPYMVSCATMGAVFMTSPCSPGQPKLRFAPGTAFRMPLNCGRPQKKTKIASTM